MSRSVWHELASGRRFYAFAPKPEDVHPEDIAHQLANICRFGGASSVFYSVAEHSLRASFLVEDLVEGRADGVATAMAGLQALVHDAHEALTPWGDVLGPYKSLPELAVIRRVEARCQEAIDEAFGVARPYLPAVEVVDRRLLLTEAAGLLPSKGDWPWARDIERFSLDDVFPSRDEYGDPRPMSPKTARSAWLRRFHLLRRRLGYERWRR